MHSGVEATAAAGTQLDLCIISNVLVYCSDQQTAEALAALLTSGCVKAILLNERGVILPAHDVLLPAQTVCYVPLTSYKRRARAAS